ncbi:hypothetical protein GOODEAATRI_028289 [Goodea atripinnis]|uniref:Peptidase A2 domain-containing protein n=1 Tax=Goodea atripinnis TaxID=208336 RepID=A0ABV0NEA2_9TELE
MGSSIRSTPPIQEMSMRLYKLEVCAALDSGAQRSVLPLHYYNAIHPDTRPSLQPSIMETLLGVRPGNVPVLGEAQIPVNIYNRQVDVNLLMADILELKFTLFLAGTTSSSLVKECSTTCPKSHKVRVARMVVVETGQES